MQLFVYEKSMFHKNENAINVILSSVMVKDIVKCSENIKCNAEWYMVRDGIMKEILDLKVHQVQQVNQVLHNKTSNAFVCCDKYDKYWSCGLDSKMTQITPSKYFPGNNKLGQLWQEVTNELRK